MFFFWIRHYSEISEYTNAPGPFRVWQTGRVLYHSRSRPAISFASITCSQKETVKFHALLLRDIAAIMFRSEKTLTPMAATRLHLGSPHAGYLVAQCVESRVHDLAIAVVALRAPWHNRGESIISDHLQNFRLRSRFLP